MAKALSEMTLEELWALFPITLTAHQDAWAAWYAAEAKRLAGILPAGVRLSHIGSTAIHGIWAKPIVDILAELDAPLSMDGVGALLAQNGYICMSRQPCRCSFNRGYTSAGFAKQVFHLHLRCAGDNDELYFRDYLNEDAALAKQYEALKLSLWRRFEHDRDGYTLAKTDFVARHTAAAKARYGAKYAPGQSAR